MNDRKLALILVVRGPACDLDEINRGHWKH
jgi:hypothetical protein